MARILYDGAKTAVVMVNAAETFDVSSLSGSPSECRILEVWYDVGTVTDCVVSWDATTDVIALTLSGRCHFNFEDFGGMPNNAGAGKTGDIVVAGTGTFTVILKLHK